MLKAKVAKFCDLIWWRQRFRQLEYRQKLNYGYAAVASLALITVAIGYTMRARYLQASVTQIARNSQGLDLVNELEKELWQAQVRQQQLILAKEPRGFKQASTQLMTSLDKIKSLTKEIKVFVSSSEWKDNQRRDERVSLGGKDLVVTSEDAMVASSFRAAQTAKGIARYSQQLKRLLQPVNASNFRPQDMQRLQQSLQVLANSDNGVQMHNLATQLALQGKELPVNEAKAFAQIQTQAVVWDTGILGGCTLITLAIAYLLAGYTSRELCPTDSNDKLSAIAKFVEQVTAESNFTLQIPVTSENEVSVLESSLNHLVTEVAHHTSQLEQSRQSLALQVEASNQQLNQAIHHLEQAQNQLIQAEKMSNLGQMVASIAHEINNPISFIYGNIKHAEEHVQNLLALVQLYQQLYPQPQAQIQEKLQAIELDFITHDLPKILDSMHMGAELIRQLSLSIRNFSRLDEYPVADVDLHAGIDNILLILNNRLSKGINVYKKYGEIPNIECYPSQLSQVFMNILSNAIDSLLATTTQIDKQIVIQTQLISPNQVEVKFWDNGAGISSDIQCKIFQPFFTTKPIGQGTGLGLAISCKIVEKHKGKITVNSDINQGTEFVLTLPIYQPSGTDN